VIRLAAVGNLYPGSVTESSSMRRVHQQNRVSTPRSSESINRDRVRLRVATYQWLRRNGTPEQRRLAFRRLMLEWTQDAPGKKNLGRLSALLRLPFRLPSTFVEGHYWHELAQAGWSIIRNDWLKLNE